MSRAGRLREHISDDADACAVHRGSGEAAVHRGARRRPDTIAGPAVHHRPGTRAGQRRAGALHGRTITLDGLRFHDDHVRQRLDLGRTGDAKPARQADHSDGSHARADAGTRTFPPHSIRGYLDTRRAGARSGCHRGTRDCGSCTAVRGRASPCLESTQGSGAVRPRLQQHLQRSSPDDGRDVPLPGPRVRVWDLHVAGRWNARPPVRLQRRLRIERVRRRAPAQGNPHHRGNAGTGEDPPVGAQPWDRPARHHTRRTRRRGVHAANHAAPTIQDRQRGADGPGYRRRRGCGQDPGGLVRSRPALRRGAEPGNGVRADTRVPVHRLCFTR